MSKFTETIVALARAEIGVTEVNGSNCGPRVNEFKAATLLNPKLGWPWCAAFVCFIVREAMAQCGIKETKTFKRPKTAGAWDFENWSLAQDDTTHTKKPHKNDIQPGDIVVLKRSHIGIAVSDVHNDGVVLTVEGNTDSSGSREGGGVFLKQRHVSELRSRIRFTI